MKKLPVLLGLGLAISAVASLAGEPPGLREAIAKHAALSAARARRLDAATIPAVAPSSPAFESARIDLNGDGIPDAIVLLTGPDYCGSGGCSLEVFRGTRHGFVFISGSTLARPPVAVLPQKRFGWHSFTVSVGGGGGKSCAVVMRFDGHRYPPNASLARCASPAQLQAATRLPMRR